MIIIPINLKKFVAALALSLFTLQTQPALQAATLVDLNLSGSSAANSATFGNGTVNLNTVGNWKNRNSTGNPAGIAFDTGASEMGIGTAGTISWTHAQANLDGLSQFSLYMWVNPATLPGGNATLVSYGNFGGTFQVGMTISTTPLLPLGW